MEKNIEIIDADNIPDIVNGAFTSKDLDRVEKAENKKSLRRCLTNLVGIIPKVGRIIKVELEVYYDFKDAQFFRNFLSFIYELKDTSAKQREDFMNEVEECAQDYSGNVLAGMISRIDNINKGKVLANLTRAKMEGLISIEDYFRIASVVERIPYTDFKFLPAFTQRNYIYGGVSEMLFSAGVLSQTGIDANVDHDWLELSPIGTMLLKYGLLIDVDLKDRTRTVIPALESIDFRPIDDEYI